MFKKENIQDFLNFKSLITEKILKYLYIGVVGLMALGSVIMILVAWVNSFKIIGRNFMGFLTQFVGTPIIVVIGFALFVLFSRLAFEAVLIHFLNYRELKKLNEK